MWTYMTRAGSEVLYVERTTTCSFLLGVSSQYMRIVTQVRTYGSSGRAV
jgi:hypothetical protein